MKMFIPPPPYKGAMLVDEQQEELLTRKAKFIALALTCKDGRPTYAQLRENGMVKEANRSTSNSPRRTRSARLRTTPLSAL